MGRYHDGEIEAQRRAGVRDLADRVGRIIGNEVPAAAAAFLAGRTFVVVATTDAGGGVHASILAGEAGFAEAQTPTAIHLRPSGGDLETVFDDLRETGVIGLLAIEFATRRRMRVNGSGTVAGEVVVIDTAEVYSNCPQYISVRPEPILLPHPTRERAAHLGARQRDLIASANTFFIASSHPGRGADASHRGGEPGFVTVTPSTISWEDAPGNNMFNTIGNLLVNDRCSLLFVDFVGGRTLRVDGRATVTWGEQRRIELVVDEVMEARE